MHKDNADIMEYANSRKVKMWQIAEIYGLHECNFSRKLRKPLSDSDRKAITEIIDIISSRED